MYEGRAGEYRRRLRHRNGNVPGDSGEGYGPRSATLDAVDRVKEGATAADLEDG